MPNVLYNNDLVKLTLLVLTRLRPYFESNLLSPKRLRLSSKKGFTFRSTLSLFDLEINQRYRVVLSIKHRYESYETHTHGSLPQPAERRPKQLIQKTNLSNPRPIEISVPVVYYIKHWHPFSISFTWCSWMFDRICSRPHHHNDSTIKTLSGLAISSHVTSWFHTNWVIALHRINFGSLFKVHFSAFRPLKIYNIF